MGGDSASFVNDAAVSSTGIVVAIGAQDPGGSFPQPLVMRSADGGLTWAESVSYPWTTPGSFNSSYVTWCEFLGLFVAVHYVGADAVLCTSADGDTWATIWTDPTSISPSKPISCDSIGLVSIPGTDFTGADSGVVLTTPDGVAVTLHTGTLTMKYPVRGAWSDSEGVAITVGRDSVAFGDAIRRSTDGINYTGISSPINATSFNHGDYVSYLPSWSAWIVSGQNGSGRLAVRSADAGLTWSTIVIPGFFNDPVSELVDGRVFDASTTPDGAVSSDGGVTWEASNSIPLSCQASVVLALPSFSRNLVAGCVQGTSGQDVVMTGTPVRILPPPSRGGGGPVLWRYFLAALDGTGVTDLSKITSDRVVEVILNGPLSMTGTVPSDNPKAWIPYDGDTYNDPYLSEGTRLMWGFRRESFTSPYYTVRGATIVNLVEDTAEGDDARTRFVGWDPWHYMMSRPVTDIDGNLPGEDGLSFNDTKVSVIVCELLRNTIINFGFAYIDAGDGSRIGEGSQYQDWGGSAEYGGFLDDTPVVNWNIPQGTSVGQAWADLCAAGQCDIILTPIYEPAGRTVGTDLVVNFLCEISVYVQAGVVRDDQIFAWNLPGRSLMGLTRQQDGSSRVNDFYAFAGPGGTGGGQATSIDNDSITKYGVYLAQQFFPGLNGPDTVANVAAAASFAQAQVALRALGRQTVTFVPAPERSPRPWQDYQLGDRMPIWASKEKFRQLLSGST
jgi:hypothetical protein